MALHDGQHVAREILAGDEPSGLVCAALSADAQALTLPERVIREPLMPPDDAAVRGLDRTRRLGQIPGEKVAERSLADKADSSRVLLRVRRDSLFAGDRAHCTLRQMTDGEKRAVELTLIEPVKKISLILRSVDRLQQQDAVFGAPQLPVMPRRDTLGA